MNTNDAALSPKGGVAGGHVLMRRRIARFRLSQDEAEDAIQETWVELLARLPSWRGTVAPEEFAWLRRVLVSKVMNLFRDKARHRMLSLDDVHGSAREPLSRAEDPAREAEAQDRSERVWEAVRGLATGKHALSGRVLIMHYQDSQTVAAIAAATGLTEKQIRDRLAWAIARLRKMLRVATPPRRKRNA